MVAIAEPRFTETKSGSSSTRERLIERIREVNPSATTGWLASFDEEALALYVEHLEAAREPRGRGARWVRPGDTRAIRGWEIRDES
jgi:hypothetical protein